MKFCLIQVPYHLGRERVGMGLGPIKFIESEIARKLSDQGYKIQVELIQLDEPFTDEIQTIIKLNQLLKEKVSKAIKTGYFPLILGGNCNTAIGTLAGLNADRMGIIWLDAHGDYNTPEISPSGFFDGMALAITTGQCYDNVWSQVADINPIKTSYTLHIGARDLDPEEKVFLYDTGVRVVRTKDIIDLGMKDSLTPIFKKLKSDLNQCYLHIDIDVIDPTESPGVDYRSPNGLSSKKVEEIIQFIDEYFEIKAAAITAYNPVNDENNKTLLVGINLINTIIEVISKLSVKE